MSADDEFTRRRLEAAGFVGWRTWAQLAATDLRDVDDAGGVYVIWRARDDQPAFLDENPGGWFKAKDPTVSPEALQANWVPGAEVVYIGKADALQRRLRQFQRFGAGVPIGHWGGRLIWQLADSVDLLVAWKLTPGQIPRSVETEMIAAFRRSYGKPPFANEPHRLGG